VPEAIPGDGHAVDERTSWNGAEGSHLIAGVSDAWCRLSAPPSDHAPDQERGSGTPPACRSGSVKPPLTAC